MEYLFKGNSPCKSCPYRMDTPLAKWSIEEFKKLIQEDNLLFGGIYGCHKNNGTVCKGWLMDQDKRGFPNLNLRMSLSTNRITRVYLDNLSSPSPLFKSIQEMAESNFPELINYRQK